MVDENPRNGRPRRPDSPSHVSITISVVPTERALRLREIRARLARASRSPPVVIALAAMITLAAAAATAALLHSSRANSVAARATATQRAATREVAAAVGYPQRCLSIAISAADPDYATAHVDRTGECANYRGYVNTSFHRVDGVWRLMLDEGQLFVPNDLLRPADAGSTGARAISGYPLACLSVAIVLHDPRFARAAFDRGFTCVRYRR